ncbi:RidA family protein [Aurantimonas sp. C2-3-R2]|uniref:RidA family protein n=1 Tax=unclassified Aurantimonas TaxID=2638230 RepID=UPI003FA44F6B
MDIKRIGRNPASGDESRSRASQISIHNGTIYFAATPDRPFNPAASVAEQTLQVLKRIEERLASAGSDKSKILIAQVWIADMRYFAEMNSVWDSWADQDSPPVRACGAVMLGHPDMKIEMIITAATEKL